MSEYIVLLIDDFDKLLNDFIENASRIKRRFSLYKIRYEYLIICKRNKVFAQ